MESHSSVDDLVRRLANVKLDSDFIAIFDKSDAIAFIKNQYGRYVYLNRTAKQFEGIQDSQEGNYYDIDVFAPETLQKVRQNDELVLQNGELLRNTTQIPSDTQPGRNWVVFKLRLLASDGSFVIGGVDIPEEQLEHFVAALA